VPSGQAFVTQVRVIIRRALLTHTRDTALVARKRLSDEGVVGEFIDHVEAGACGGVPKSGG
jgi:hypothetical protein